MALLGFALGLAGFPMLLCFVAAALKLFLSARLIEGFAFAIVLTVWGLSVLLSIGFATLGLSCRLCGVPLLLGFRFCMCVRGVANRWTAVRGSPLLLA